MVFATHKHIIRRFSLRTSASSAVKIFSVGWGEFANPNNIGVNYQHCWASCLSANLRKNRYAGYSDLCKSHSSLLKLLLLFACFSVHLRTTCFCFLKIFVGTAPMLFSDGDVS